MVRAISKTTVMLRTTWAWEWEIVKEVDTTSKMRVVALKLMLVSANNRNQHDPNFKS